MPPAQQESERLAAFRRAFEEGYRAWNEGDVRAAYAGLPDELDYRLAPTWPDAQVLRSRDEVVAFFEAFQETFPDARTGAHEFIDGPGEAVVVGFHVTGSGRSSGAAGEMEVWQVWELSEELIAIRVTEFSDRAQALEAGGVEEPNAEGAG